MNEKAIAAALEPLVDDLVRLERKLDTTIQRTAERLDTMPLTPGPKGDAGDPGGKGDPGAPGESGAGIDSPLWEAGAVYRKGTHVVANMGQHFVALRDTASSTDDGDHWQRVGSGGFRHRGTFKADATYADGDLFLKDYGTFLVVRGAPIAVAGRGSKGEPGAPGLPGKNGRDGSTIIGANATGFSLVLIQRDADGSIDHIEADFGPAFRDAVKHAVALALPELTQAINELREDVDDLVRLRGRAS